MEPRKVRLFDAVDFSVVDYKSATDIIITKAKAKESFGVFPMPVHGLVLAASNHPLARAVINADMIVPDGHPVRWVMNLFYNTKLIDRVYGPTLTLHILAKANQENLNVFLYGGNSEDTLNKFANFISTQYPNVNVCGKYREAFPNDDTLDLETITKSNAHIVLVGRGCPAQEIWIAERKFKINAVMIAVGAAFSFHAGVLEQAPKWMQDRGLEWLFRLLKEPKRLFKRYLITNSIFIYLVVKEIINKKVLTTYRIFKNT